MDEMYYDRPLWAYDMRQVPLNQRAALRDMMFREHRQNQPNPINAGNHRQHPNQQMMAGQNRVHNPMPMAYNPYQQNPYDANAYDYNQYGRNQYARNQYAPNHYGRNQYAPNHYGRNQYDHHQYNPNQYNHNQYDPRVNMQLYHYFNGHNGYVYNGARAYQPQQQVNIEAPRYMGYNYVQATPQVVNADGAPLGLYNVINPAPCFCDAYSIPGGSVDLTACGCDVCLRLCRHEPLHVCILDNSLPPDCTNCGSPRNIGFPHNCNVCYPVGVICCEEACALDEIAQNMQNNATGNSPAYPQQPQ